VVPSFEDECRFGRQGTLTRVRATTGSRPTAVRQTQYGYVHVLAVASPVTGHSEALITPVLNAGVVNTFLEQFSTALPADVHAALIWDGAGYHTAKSIRCPANITLIQLPPYSPERNPVENLWHHLRSHHWSNRHDKDVDAPYDAAEDGWRRCCLDPAIVKSVCGAPYVTSAGIS
jgi:hypothetical protein